MRIGVRGSMKKSSSHMLEFCGRFCILVLGYVRDLEYFSWAIEDISKLVVENWVVKEEVFMVVNVRLIANITSTPSISIDTVVTSHVTLQDHKTQPFLSMDLSAC